MCDVVLDLIRAAAKQVVDRNQELRNEAAFRCNGSAKEYDRVLVELVAGVIAETLGGEQ